MYNDDNLATGYMIGRDGSNNNGFGYGAEWVWIIVLFALFGGWGNGFGGFGGSNAALTRGDLCQDMNFNNLDGAVRGISQGICDSTFALNNTMTNGFAGVQQTLCQGFNGVNTAVLQSANATERGFAQLGYNLQQCCCEQKQIALENRYLNAQQTCDLITNQNSNTQRILDYLCQEKISGLQAENAALTAQLSQNAQTTSIVNQLRPCPIPAYITCNPYESAYGFGRNNCGCGC